MDTESKLTMQIVEVLHYCSDVDASIKFYSENLGWPVIWQSPGNMAVMDAGGAYQLTLIAAKWTEGWEEGRPVPCPRLAFESKDIHADRDLLESRGIEGLEVGGDPTSMLMMDLIDPELISHFIWQDTVEAGATKVVDEYKANRQPAPLYSLGECLLFVNDKEGAESFYIEKLGFEVKNRHGDVFTGFNKDNGPVLGVYHWPRWWEKPVQNAPNAPVRLFLECPDIEKEHLRQSENGITPQGIQSGFEGLRWFNLDDPDGNTITFWQYEPCD